MKKINFQNNITKVNKTTFDEFQNNIEESCVIVSPTEPTTNEKVWIQKGKNLFNKDTALIGFWVKNGQPEYTPDKLTNVLSDYISVKPNTTYTISGCIIGLWTCVYSYNENKTYYDEIAYTNTSEILTFTTGENDYYIRVAFGEGLPNIDLIQIEEGSTATEYEAYVDKKINIDGVEFLDVEKANAQQNYSRGEQVIGTWIDGKPIYRKVIATTMPSTISETGTGFETLLMYSNDIDKIWLNLGKSFIHREKTTTEIPALYVPLVYLTSLEGSYVRTNIQARYVENTYQYFAYINSNYITMAGRTVYLTIEYTKTTD